MENATEREMGHLFGLIQSDPAPTDANQFPPLPLEARLALR